MKKIRLLYQSCFSECGLCCIAMISSYHGKNRLISEYREEFKIGRDGLSLIDMVHLLENDQFEAKVMKTNIVDIKELFSNQNPMILFLNFNHYVVLENEKNDIFTILDPARGRIKLTMKELSEIFGGYVVQVNPKENFGIKSKEKSDFRYIVTILKRIKQIFLLALAITVLSYSVSMLTPLQIQVIVDTITSGQELNIKSILSVLSILMLSTIILSLIRNRVLIKMQVRLFNELTEETISHLLKIPYSFFDNRSEGNILFRLDVMGQIRSFIATNLIQIIISLISIIVIIVYMSICFPDLVVLVIMTIFIMGVAILTIGSKLLKLQRENMNFLEASNNIQTEIVSNIYQIKCLKIEDYFLRDYRTHFKLFKQSFKKTQSVSLNFNMYINLFNTFVPIIIFVLCATVFNFGYTLGQLFFLYTLITSVLGLTYNLFNEILIVSTVKASLFYLNDLLDEKEIEDNGTVLIENFQNVEFQNIKFRYSMSTANILDNISLKIHKGDKVSLVGYSGSGKSTLIKLLSNMYNADEGALLINGVEVNQINLDNLKKMFAVVPQSPILFNKTIKENLLLGKTNVSDEEIYRALEIACLREEIEKMPMKVNTLISNSGGNISGGQTQRMAIARAIISGAEVLILDEATSSLDVNNEQKIYKNLKELGYTLLVITHRLSSIYDSDKIYIMNDGKIISEGKHLDLLNNCNLYKELIKNQESEN